ncbi:MAG TPA: serine protease [Myxococcales bacterium]|jgi:S1-C subfamily serine protease
MILYRPAALAGLTALAFSALPWSSALAEPEPLTPHAFRRLVERVQPCVLKVVSQPSGFAVLVGVKGELIADDKVLGKDAVTVAVEVKGERREATLITRDTELGLALLRLPDDEYPAASVGEAKNLQRGDALVGLSFDAKKGPVAEPGHFAGTRDVKGVTRLRNDVAGPPGTALFNTRGQLVAVHAGRSHATVAIEELRERFSKKRPE